jgi:hypothetical protein
MAVLKQQQRGGAHMGGSSRRSIGGGGVSGSSLAIPRTSVNVAKRGGARSRGRPRPLATTGAQRIPPPPSPTLRVKY